jgi:hypothetical protein
MNRDDIQKLLGGYATGTLTPEERQALFEAALTDQELFDALAREEALREVLSDPVSRAQVLAAIDEVPAPWYRHWWRPMVVIATAALLVVGVAVYTRGPKPPQLAKVELPRFRPPAEAQSQPMLPAPPELRRESPVLKPLPIPLPAVKPPAPPTVAVPAAAAAPPVSRDAFVAAGSGSLDAPMQRQSQQSQTLGGLQSQNSSVLFDPSAKNGFLASANVPVRGTVTDASGAGIGSANVVVRSLATGETVNTSTDSKGEFIAPEKPGSAYQISASAPGFKATTVSQATPVTGAPEPVNLRLDVGAATETVEVTAAAAPIHVDAVQMESRAAGSGGRGGRGGAGFGGALAEMKKAQVAQPPVVDYHLMQRQGGKLQEVPADGTVQAGSSLVLRVTAAADGYLGIVEGTRTIASPKVRGGVTRETTLPKFAKPGRVELRVYFSRRAFASQDEAAPFVTIAFHIE